MTLLKAVKLWIDSSAEGDQTEGDTVEITRLIPFIFLHVACFGVFWVGWSWTAVGIAVALYVVRMFAITGFYHRYFSHKTFKTSRVAQFLFGVLGSSAIQRGPIWWAAHHRHHHKHADEEVDPHSPHQHGFFWSHMLWFMTKTNFKTNTSRVKDLLRYPELRFIDRFDTVVPILMFVALYGIGEVLASRAPELGATGPQLLIWGIVSSIVLFHGTCTINSLAHQFGTRRFDTEDHSRNNWWLAIVTLGEGWHNNHHRYPNTVRQGFYWWEIDVTYYGLRTLELLGIIKDLKPVPAEVLAEGRLADNNK